jgi:ATP synthase F1 gamma subunit
MLNIREIKSEKETTQSIKVITQTLGDIATIKVRAIKKTALENATYFNELTSVYKIVRYLDSKRKDSSKTPLKGENVFLLLTSNEKFHGRLDLDLTKFFMSMTDVFNGSGEKTKIIVIGKYGLSQLKVFSFKPDFSSINFNHDYPTLVELKNLVEEIKDYHKILVFHTKFVTILNQVPTITDISPTKISSKEQKVNFNFILEPEIGKMLKFFEGQVLISLLQSIFLEVELARESARMIHMNQADDNAKKIIDADSKAILKIRKEKINIRLLETYAGRLATRKLTKQ